MGAWDDITERKRGGNREELNLLENKILQCYIYIYIYTCSSSRVRIRMKNLFVAILIYILYKKGIIGRFDLVFGFVYSWGANPGSGFGSAIFFFFFYFFIKDNDFPASHFMVYIEAFAQNWHRISFDLKDKKI